MQVPEVESSSALYRAWLLRHQPTEIEQIETAASRVREHVGEHAAALDLLRWAEVANICPNPAESIQWRALHWKVCGMSRRSARRPLSALRRYTLASGAVLLTWRRSRSMSTREEGRRPPFKATVAR